MKYETALEILEFLLFSPSAASRRVKHQSKPDKAFQDMRYVQLCAQLPTAGREVSGAGS